MATNRFDGENQRLSAYERLQPFIGVADSGGKQLSAQTGKQLRNLLANRYPARTADRFHSSP